MVEHARYWLLTNVFIVHLAQKVKMDRNANPNIASNYCYTYGLDKNKCLDDLKQLVVKYYPKQYQIYSYIYNHAPNYSIEMHERFYLRYYRC